MQKEIDCADLRELLWRGNGTLLLSDSHGTIVRSGEDGAIITDYADAERLCRRLDKLNLGGELQFSVKSEEVAEALSLHFGLTKHKPCTQWVYTKKTPPPVGDYNIHLLPECDAELAAAQYHLMEDTLPYIKDRIASRRLWGLYEDGKLAGFIGMHTEGSMGILEVLPEYRRKGYGYALEAFLIGWHLGRGYIPFGQVYKDNPISDRLQAKLGLVKGGLPTIWVY